MKTIRNKRAVLKHSANLRWVEITVVLTLLNLAADLLESFKAALPVAPVWLVAGASVAGSIAWIARFIVQEKVSGGGDADQ